MEAIASWQQYERIQVAIIAGSLCGAALVALEIKLDQILEDVSQGLFLAEPIVPPEKLDLNTAMCRERRHARLQARYLISEPLRSDGEGQANAVILMEELQHLISPDDWQIIFLAAQGYSYDEIGMIIGGSAGSMRTRTSRARASLRAA